MHEQEGGHDRLGIRPQDGREVLAQEVNLLNEKIGGGKAWDDISGAELDVDNVRAARVEEMKFFKDMNAYTSTQRDGGAGEWHSHWHQMAGRQQRGPEPPELSFEVGGPRVQNVQG